MNGGERLLTVIVPAYNMERCLEKNLNTYVSEELFGKISVIVLDNSSEDGTLGIAKSFEERYPDTFTAITKENNGYGSSVNLGMQLADGKYFKVIDADDCADTGELIKFVENLRLCDADVVETPYFTVDVKSGEVKKIALNSEFGKTQPISAVIGQAPIPCLHTTALRTDFVRKNPFTLLENAYYVDEELAIYPFFNAKTVCAFDNAVYRYSVNDDGQSVSVKNKVKNLSHRDRIIKRLMERYESENIPSEVSDFCFRRVARSVGDHFTTLYVLHRDKREGRRLARELSLYLKDKHPEFYNAVKKKRFLLSVLNRLHVSIASYEKIKKLFGYKENSSL